MSQCNTAFDLKINLGHIDQYHGPVIFLLLFFAQKNIFVLLAKLSSGELRYPPTALIIQYTFIIYLNISKIPENTCQWCKTDIISTLLGSDLATSTGL